MTHIAQQYLLPQVNTASSGNGSKTTSAGHTVGIVVVSTLIAFYVPVTQLHNVTGYRID